MTDILEAEVEEKASLPAIIEAPVNDVPALRKAVEFESERIELMQRFVASKMTKGTHFGTIPGTTKPTLFKAGAEVMCGIYKYGAKYEVKVAEDLAAVHASGCKGFYEAQIRCTLFHTPSGTVVGEGVGSCNNWEKKYLRRDLFDVKNTVLKIAKKRAYIDATLSACRLSDFFTQDLEDFQDESRHDREFKKEVQRDQDRPYKEPSDSDCDPLRQEMIKHTGSLENATLLMQIMAKVKPDYQVPRGWGAMEKSAKWRNMTKDRFRRHCRLCDGTDCPEVVKSIFDAQGYVEVGQ